jgi:hypothetical protein
VSRRYDIRKVKLHHCYTTLEITQVFGVSISTVSKWTTDGLYPIDRGRPYLYLGAAIAAFLKARAKPRHPSGPGEMFCVACKSTISPAGMVADLIARTPTTGDLVGECPHCGRRAHRRVRLSEVAAKAGKLRVRHEDATTPIMEGRDTPRTLITRRSSMRQFSK